MGILSHISQQLCRTRQCILIVRILKLGVPWGNPHILPVWIFINLYKNHQHCSFQQDGLLNFDKHRKAFEILVQLTLYQKAAANYSFPHHPPLERWLSETPLLPEQER